MCIFAVTFYKMWFLSLFFFVHRFLGKVGGVIASSEDAEKSKDGEHLRETSHPMTLPSVAPSVPSVVPSAPSVVPSAPSVIGDSSLGYSLPTPPRSPPPPYRSHVPHPTEKLLNN